MNESTGFPAPTLPPPGAAATAPPPPLLSPVARAVGGLAAPGLGAPPATTPLTAPSLPGPSLPGLGAPTLPRSRSATPPTPPFDHASPLPLGAAEIPDISSPDRSPSPTTSGSSWKSKALALVLIVAFAAVTYFAVTNSATDDADSAPQPVVATVAPRPTSPLVAPINDAEAVVEQINDNAVEEEILGELGLGPTGQEADVAVDAADQPNGTTASADAPTSTLDASAVNYSVERGDGPAYEIWLDTASGNRELFDGSTYVRVVDGLAYTSGDPAGPWRADAASAPTEVLAGSGTVMRFDDVLPAEMLEAAAASAASDDSGSVRYLFVDTEFAATASELRTAWLSSWGFDPAAALITIDGLVDSVPDAAQPGEMLISIASTADGVVTDLTIEAPALGETLNYRLIGASNEPLLLEVPTSLSE